MTVVLAFLPVCSFLASLIYMDSYKLVRLNRVLSLTAYGAVAAVASYIINGAVLDAGLVDRQTLTEFVAPAVEEALKILPIMILFRARRIGFVIDAAICGFAAGAGFALVENLYYLAALGHPDLGFWVVRGFGTAVMHGGTTAIAAMVTKAIYQRRESEPVLLALPGLLLAYAIHSMFNQFILSPYASALVVTAVLPPLLVLIFAQSERYVQGWLGSGFDLDSELLKAMRSGDFRSSRPGRYLQSLRDHFDGAVVADMLCYLRVSTELSLRAKGVLLLRESGLPVPRDEATAAKLAELQYLKTTIGRTGQLALAPVLRTTAQDIWQLQLLDGRP